MKFATYTRDSATGNDYADQRYYASTFGRFMTPDPYKASGGNRNPGSWNRYTYTLGDPVNGVDPAGRDDCTPSAGVDFCVAGTAPPPDESLDFPFPWGGGALGGGDSEVPLLLYRGAFKTGPVSTADQTKANELLGSALAKAIEALVTEPDCLALFKAKDGSYLTDPVTGGVLDPLTVLTGLVHAGTTGTNRGWGTLTFAYLDAKTFATIQGIGPQISLQGLYYSQVFITFNLNYWNLGSVFDDTTALLHELGHAISDLAAGFGPQNSFQSDRFSSGASTANTQMVEDKCTRNLKF